MPTRYLLDTNMASYVIKGNIPRVRERLLKVPMAQISISVVTEAELRFGVARRPEAVRLKTAVESFCCGSIGCPGTRRPPNTMRECVLPSNVTGRP